MADLQTMSVDPLLFKSTNFGLDEWLVSELRKVASDYDYVSSSPKRGILFSKARPLSITATLRLFQEPTQAQAATLAGFITGGGESGFMVIVENCNRLLVDPVDMPVPR